MFSLPTLLRPPKKLLGRVRKLPEMVIGVEAAPELQGATGADPSSVRDRVT